MITFSRPAPISWVVLGCILVFVISVRVRLMDTPFERDEGEYAYMGQLILQGVPPYEEAYNMKLPGTNLMYALAMALFGQTVAGVHAGLMAVNCAAIVLVFVLARFLMSDGASLGAAAAYALLSLSHPVFGFAAHATHFVVLPALAGSVLLLAAADRRAGPLNFFWPGLFFGTAFIMKQPGIFYLLFGVSYLLYDHVTAGPPRPVGRLATSLSAFAAGGAIPLLGVVLWVAASGNFDNFWFWTVRYAASYVTQVSLQTALDNFEQGLSLVTTDAMLLWLVAAAGFVLVFFRAQGSRRAFLSLFLLFSFLTVVPGFYFRSHYFVTLLPALALGAGFFIDAVNGLGGNVKTAPLLRLAGSAIFIGAAAACIAAQGGYLFRDDPRTIVSRTYSGNPFVESVEVAKFIAARSSPSDRIAVFGSEPQIYFYAKRRVATGFLYTYGLMESQPSAQDMQRKMMREIESSRPKFIVAVHDDLSWLVRPQSDRTIFDWFDEYVNRRYRVAGVVDMISPGRTVYLAGNDAGNYVVQSPDYLTIYERK